MKHDLHDRILPSLLLLVLLYACPVYARVCPAPPAVTQSSINCNTNVQLQAYSSDGSDGNYLYYLYTNPAASRINQNASGTFDVTISNATMYYVSIYDVDAGCESSKQSINAVPGVPPALSAYGYSCVAGTAMVFMTGELNAVFDLIRYDGSGYTTVASNSTGVFSFNTLSSSYQYFAQTVRSGCTARNLITIDADYVNSPAVTGNTSLCYGQSVSLQASGSNSGYRWYDDVNMSHQVGYTAVFTPSNTESKTYYVVNTGEYCVSSPTAIAVNVYQSNPPVVNNATGFEKVTLSVAAPLPNVTYRWYATANSDFAIFTGASYESLTTQTYYVSATLQAGSVACLSNRSAVTGTVLPVPVVMRQGALNLGEIVTLTTSNYDTYQWIRDDVVITGAEAGTLQVSVPGEYKVQVAKSGVQGTPRSRPVQVSYGVDINENYLMTQTVLKENLSNAADLNSISADDVSQQIDYMDGLGRTMQTIQTQGSPLKNDLVQPVKYDAYGRENIKYLPFSSGKTGAYKPSNEIIDGATGGYIGAAQEFYSTGVHITADAKPYAITEFEASPLNRVLKQGAPGAAWQPDGESTTDHVLRTSYDFNEASAVYLFVLDTNSNLVTVNPAQPYYKSNQLYALRTKDENKNDVVTYTTKLGKTVCKKVYAETINNIKHYAETYYLYDDFGNLIVVLPPEGVEKLKANLD